MCLAFFEDIDNEFASTANSNLYALININYLKGRLFLLQTIF